LGTFPLTRRFDDGRHVHTRVDLHQFRLPVPPYLIVNFFLEHAELNDAVLLASVVGVSLLIVEVHCVGKDRSLVQGTAVLTLVPTSLLL